MKKTFLTVVLLCAAGLAFAQEKNVKEAKKLAGAVTPDFVRAEQLIGDALTNPETKDLAETWNVAGFVQERRMEKEMENAYLQQPYDTVQLYKSTLDMCKYYLKCDELAQVPNEKGKVKNKYRKANSATMLGERNNLLNGGIEFYNRYLSDNNKETGKRALDCFAMYIDMASHPMFEKANLVQTDTLLPQVAYYAGMTALKLEDYPSILKYTPMAQDNKEVGMYAMELVSTALKAEGDTVKWLASLQEGMRKYPQHAFFFGHMVDYYSNNNKFDEAIRFADEMLAKDPSNPFNLYVEGYLYHNKYSVLAGKEDSKAEAEAAMNKAMEYYQKAIAVDPKYVEAYSNLGQLYCLQAQDYSSTATTDINDPAYQESQEKLKGFYLEAKKYYERARELSPEQKNLWMQGLSQVYYVLGMGAEYEALQNER